MSVPQVMAQLGAQGVIPVVRTATAGQAEQAVQWLFEAGFRTFEITLTIDDAVSVIRNLSAVPGMLVGAGTVLREEQALACIEAGAAFLVSPAVSRDMARICARHGRVCMLGAATPTEVLSALGAGADVVKIFPVSSFGGAAHVKALRAVFPQVALCPTGGIGVTEIGTYLRAGAAFVGVGGTLVDVGAIERGDAAAVKDAARQALAQVSGVRDQGP